MSAPSTSDGEGFAASTNRAPDPRERLPLSKILAYGIPSFGFATGLFFVQFYFLKFATDVLLLAPAAVGILFAAGRIWDGIAAPLVGYLSDATHHRMGRRRPWLFAAVVPFGIALTALWNFPATLSQGALLVWTGCALFAFYTAQTAYEIPYRALGMELSSDFHERSRIFGLQRMAFTLGTLGAFGLIQVVAVSADPRAAAGQIAIGLAVAAGLAMLVPPVALRERPEFLGRGAKSVFSATRDVLGNSHARRLLVVWFIDGFGGGMVGTLAPYVSQYVLKRPDLTALLPTFYVVAAIVTIPGWIALSRRYGKRDVYVFSLVLGASSFGATMLLGEGDLILVCLLLLGAGASGGCSAALAPSILADVVDHDEVETDERKEGAYSAATGFTYQFAAGLVVFAAGVVLQATGFVPNQPQSPAVILALKGLFGGLPLVGFLLAALVLRGYTLDEKEHRRLRRVLDARQTGA